jgi:hypothetical protein
VRVGVAPEEAAVVFTELLLVRTTGSREPVGE